MTSGKKDMHIKKKKWQRVRAKGLEIKSWSMNAGKWPRLGVVKNKGKEAPKSVRKKKDIFLIIIKNRILLYGIYWSADVIRRKDPRVSNYGVIGRTFFGIDWSNLERGGKGGVGRCVSLKLGLVGGLK